MRLVRPMDRYPSRRMGLHRCRILDPTPEDRQNCQTNCLNLAAVGGIRDARARLHGHHPGHLLPRVAYHARERRRSDGGRAFLTRWCTNWCGRGLRLSSSLFSLFYFAAFCSKFTSAGGRARTDTVLSHHRILSPARLPIPPLRHALGRGDYSMGRVPFGVAYLA